MPGSVNVKHAHRPVAKLCDLDARRRYPARVLLGSFGAHADPPRVNRPARPWRSVDASSLRDVLRTDPGARERVGIALGGRVRSSGSSLAVVCDVPCPGCGRAEVWF
jgi:hypothetical protein